jgi:molybdopterin-guanine dinucleotide biosynthesis protein A
MQHAIVLAGGRSSRFGKDKAFVKVGDSTIVESLLFPLRLLFDKIILVTNHPEKYRFLGVKTVADKIKGIGPLGGLYTGLINSDTERNFVVACDMPLLNANLIARLISIKEGQVVVPRIKGKLEPLHAVYCKSLIPIIQKQIAKGDYKIQNFFDQVKVHFVEEDEVRKFDPDLTSFLNINLQKDLKEIKACLKK